MARPAPPGVSRAGSPFPLRKSEKSGDAPSAPVRGCREFCVFAKRFFGAGSRGAPCGTPEARDRAWGAAKIFHRPLKAPGSFGCTRRRGMAARGGGGGALKKGGFGLQFHELVSYI